MFSARFIVLNLLLLQESLCSDGQCEVLDDECVKKSTAIVYPLIVEGRPGVETSDPLLQNLIKLNLKNLSYTLRNAKMTGLKQCEIDFVRFHKVEQALTYGFLIPTLTITGEYEVDGHLNNTAVNGRGTCKFVYSDYYITFRDSYAKSYDANGRLHHHIINYTFDEEVRGTKTYEYKYLKFGGDNDVSEENLIRLDEAIRKPVMNYFIEKHVKNVNNYLDIVPIGDIIPKSDV